jgi:hypothetical protein
VNKNQFRLSKVIVLELIVFDRLINSQIPYYIHEDTLHVKTKTPQNLDLTINEDNRFFYRVLIVEL